MRITRHPWQIEQERKPDMVIYDCIMCPFSRSRTELDWYCSYIANQFDISSPDQIPWECTLPKIQRPIESCQQSGENFTKCICHEPWPGVTKPHCPIHPEGYLRPSHD
jgi:hypothetical protein